jgi:hypothetical protein
MASSRDEASKPPEVIDRRITGTKSYDLFSAELTSLWRHFD